jgi:hypothetical protein
MYQKYLRSSGKKIIQYSLHLTNKYKVIYLHWIQSFKQACSFKKSHPDLKQFKKSLNKKEAYTRIDI